MKLEAINFPAGMPEDERVKVCNLLVEKDNEIKRLDMEIDSLNHLINGKLYGESESLKDKNAVLEFTLTSIDRELQKINLKIIKYVPKNSPHMFEIKIERKTLWERFTINLGKFWKSIALFEIRRIQK